MKTHYIPSLRCQAHWQNAPSQRCDQILPKSLPALPTPAHSEKNIAAKMREKLTIDKKGQLVTSCIVHLAESVKFEGFTSYKLYSGLSGWCFVNAKRHHTRDR